MQAWWMVLAAFFFASMTVCVKFASQGFNAAELVFYRGLLGMLFMWLLARSQRVGLGTHYAGMHAWRSMIGVASLGGWFYCIAHLPLATAVTLNYMSSIWIAVFIVGGAIIAWRPSPDRRTPPLQGSLVLTVVVGFVGVVMLLRPSMGPHQGFAAMVGVLSGICAALAYMQVTALSRIGEPETRVVFYFSAGSAVAGLGGTLATGLSAWNWKAAIWVVPLGLLASLGQLCMTRAYSRAGSQRGTLVVANLQYSGIVFAAIYGMALFGDRLPWMGWAGMLLIVGSGIAATVLRKHAAPDAPEEEH
ncbi:DMT family transporter [Ramlibacter sp. H39-3-26]|uniref:DMT family transporter n=1 Tax=Curvibacter soli TaxID=3031331 RepID=UPI0023DAC12C|nr:DMT family transporter [Ramlibacter sp. H39-3-26]MDF1485059.1 DMT family transporter [Ramlibacter sp. H39-3-26]